MESDQVRLLREWIIKLVGACEDESLLDLLYKLLVECGAVVKPLE